MTSFGRQGQWWRLWRTCRVLKVRTRPPEGHAVRPPSRAPSPGSWFTDAVRSTGARHTCRIFVFQPQKSSKSFDCDGNVFGGFSSDIGVRVFNWPLIGCSCLYLDPTFTRCTWYPEQRPVCEVCVSACVPPEPARRKPSASE